MTVSRRSLQRVGEVGWVGVWRRLSQPLRARIGARAHTAWHATFGRPLTDADLLTAALGRDGADSGGIATLFARLGRGSFYLESGDPALRVRFHERHPAAVKRILQQAESALAGDLGWVVPGGLPDWHAALPDGGRWPLVPRNDLGIGDDRPRGDVRLTWEVGRCPHLVRLAQAAWLTEDPRFARGAVEGLRAFVAANPPGLGIAWAHAQEVALRAVAWLWCFHLLRDQPVFDLDVFRLWLGAILCHGEFVAADLSDGVYTHNHLVSELGGLAVLGLSLPELLPAARWRARGLRLLVREIRKQVDEEGVQAELSTHYHAFELDTFVATFLLARRRNVRIAADVGRRVEGMAVFVAQLLGTDGTIPAIGDTDAGRAFRLGTDPLDRRDVVGAAAALFERTDLGAIAGDADAAFWLTGGRAVPGADLPPPAGSTHCFRRAGVAVARSGFGREDEMVVFCAGATGIRRDVPFNHAHSDALSVLLRLGGSEVLIDPGTYLYSEGEGWRNALRRSKAHGCIVLDDRDQSDVTSHRFGVADLRLSRWILCEGTGDRLLAEAVHPRQGTPSVRRRVVWLRGGCVALCDDVEADGEHDVRSWLQLPAGRGEPSDSALDLVLENGLRVRIDVCGSTSPMRLHRGTDLHDPGVGWRSRRYGSLEPAISLEVPLSRGRGPWRLITVVQADRAKSPAPASIEIARDGAAHVEIRGRSLSFGARTGIRVGDDA